MSECGRRRRHSHGGRCRSCGKRLINVGGRKLHDDGSICDAVVTPQPATYEPQRALAFIMALREGTEAELRRNIPKSKTTKRRRRK